MSKLLILGGTAEATELARVLKNHHEVEVSLAGRVKGAARRLHDKGIAQVREGGFGGAEALATYLQDQGFDALIDATHPFAQRISQNALTACDSINLPRLLYQRPQWEPEEWDKWIEVGSVQEAAERLPGLCTCAFLTLGESDLSAFVGIEGVKIVTRQISPPQPDFPLPDATVILARPPFDPLEEEDLILQEEIDLIVSKNSGGDLTAGKLKVARGLGLRVLMIARPEPPPGPLVRTIEEVMAWLLVLPFLPR